MTATADPTAGPSVALRTAHDHALVVTALEHREETLEKLEKKNQEEGYGREARIVAADRAAIKQVILPVFRGQAQMSLVAEGALQAKAREMLRSRVHQTLVQFTTDVKAAKDKDDQRDLLADRETRLLDGLAYVVEVMLLNTASEGYAAGLAARESAPDVVAVRALDSLREDL